MKELSFLIDYRTGEILLYWGGGWGGVGGGATSAGSYTSQNYTSHLVIQVPLGRLCNHCPMLSSACYPVRLFRKHTVQYFCLTSYLPGNAL